MDIKAVQNVIQAGQKKTAIKQMSKEKKENGVNQNALDKAAGVVFEKSQELKNAGTYSNLSKENLAEVDRLKLQVDQKMEQAFYMMAMEAMDGQNTGLKNAIEQILSERADKITPEMVEQAEADVSEGGFFSPESVSERILDFAKAISNGNNAKSDLLKNAFIKGFEDSAKIWGDDLPEISQKTYDLVMEGFDAWNAESAETSETSSDDSPNDEPDHADAQSK